MSVCAEFSISNPIKIAVVAAMLVLSSSAAPAQYQAPQDACQKMKAQLDCFVRADTSDDPVREKLHCQGYELKETADESGKIMAGVLADMEFKKTLERYNAVCAR